MLNTGHKDTQENKLPIGAVLLVKLEPDKVILSLGNLLTQHAQNKTPKARNINGELYDQYAIFG